MLQGWQESENPEQPQTEESSGGESTEIPAVQKEVRTIPAMTTPDIMMTEATMTEAMMNPVTMMTDIMMMEAMMTAPIMNNAENMRKTSKQGDVRRHIPFFDRENRTFCVNLPGKTPEIVSQDSDNNKSAEK